jgi:hypothetical protein
MNNMSPIQHFGVVITGVAAILATAAVTAPASADFPRAAVAAFSADEGTPHNLITALKADEGVPQNLVTA